MVHKVSGQFIREKCIATKKNEEKAMTSTVVSRKYMFAHCSTCTSWLTSAHTA